jgi:hypothetical protein
MQSEAEDDSVEGRRNTGSEQLHGCHADEADGRCGHSIQDVANHHLGASNQHAEVSVKQDGQRESWKKHAQRHNAGTSNAPSNVTALTSRQKKAGGADSVMVLQQSTPGLPDQHNECHEWRRQQGADCERVQELLVGEPAS